MDIFAELAEAITAGNKRKLMEEIDQFFPCPIPFSNYEASTMWESLKSNPDYRVVSATEIKTKHPYVRSGDIVTVSAYMVQNTCVWNISYGTLKYGIIRAKYSDGRPPTITMKYDSSTITIEFGYNGHEFKKFRAGFPETHIIIADGYAFYIPDIGLPTVNHSLTI
jgi:hypothetical protein